MKDRTNCGSLFLSKVFSKFIGSRTIFLLTFTTWGFVFPQLVCLHGYCYREMEVADWVRSHGIFFSLILVLTRISIIAGLPFFLAGLWAFLR